MLRTDRVNLIDWQTKFNQISRKLDNRNINLEVMSLDIGDQFAANSVHLRGLTYEPRDNVIEIASDDFAHIVHSPSEVYLTFEEDNIESIVSIELVDSENRKHVVTFEKALYLQNN